MGSVKEAGKKTVAASPKTGIPRHDYNLLLEHYETYLRKIAAKYVGSHPILCLEDLLQELRLKLWECQQWYPTETDAQFHDLLVTSLMNRIYEIFRLKSLGHDKEVRSLDYTPDADGRANSRSDAYPISRTEESEDFYRAGIFELLTTLPTKDAKVVMDHMDGSKKGPLPGARDTYYVVKRALNGE